MPVRLSGSISGYTELAAPATANNNQLVLPTGNGSTRQAIVGDGAGALSFQWDAGSLFYRLNTDTALPAATTSAQAIFGVGATLAANTVYAFEANYLLAKTAIATAHFISLGFGGTSTLNNILYYVHGYYNNSASTLNNGGAAYTGGYIATASATQVNNTSTASANVTHYLQLKGTFSVNAGGTFIPQLTTSAAVGPYSTVAGSYIKLTPIGAAGSNSSQGTWS
jgi:hypothetical protein